MAELTVRETEDGGVQYRVDNKTWNSFITNDSLTVGASGQGALSTGLLQTQMGTHLELQRRINDAIAGLPSTIRDGMRVYNVEEDFIENLNRGIVHAAPAVGNKR